MSSDEAVLDSPIETGDKKRPRGRPRKEPAKHATIISDVPNPPRFKYYSDSASPNQRTAAGLKWWNELSDPAKELIDVTVYRDWPVLNDPTEEAEYKYIDKLLGTQPLKNDQDFIDRWGAGDYHAYVNVTPLGGVRRTIMMLFIKGSHDFKTYLPTDQRVDNPANLSISDPANASYVQWLRSTGKIKDDAATAKEKEEMSATAEVLGKVLDQNTAVMNRMLDEKDKQLAEVAGEIPPEPPPSPQEVISEQLSIFKSLKELVPTSDPLEMVKQVIGMAQVLTQKDSSGNADLKPLMDEIAKLREESRATEREFFHTQLSDIKDQLRAAKETPPASNVLLPDGSNLETVIQKIVDRVVDKPEDNPWLDIIKQAIPIVSPLLTVFAQQLLIPRPQQTAQPFPMPPGSPQPQAQLPAPAQQQQPTQQAQPQPQQTGAYTTGNPQLDALLMAITVPLADCLRDGETGAVFADEFIEIQGIETHAMLSQVGVDTIANIIAAYPPLAGVMKKVPREKLMQFVTEFVQYKESQAPAGGAV